MRQSWQECANCDCRYYGPDRTWCCPECHSKPWPQGARFVLTKLWRDGEDEHGGYALHIVDRAFNHRPYRPEWPGLSRQQTHHLLRKTCRQWNRELQ